ncbi:MAG: signal peptidase II [Rickettsiales bacterium]|nr:signal peptidase II [Rickettsiales bacterium]
MKLKDIKIHYFIAIILIAIFVAVIDIYTKRLAFNYIDEIAIIQNQSSEGFAIEINPFLNLVKVWNRGISFGMFNWAENSRIIFTILQSFIALIILIWGFFNQQKKMITPLGLIIGGAFGNVVDRFLMGAVADFIDFHIYDYHWPAFNFADSAVFIGVSLILLFDIFTKNKSI